MTLLLFYLALAIGVSFLCSMTESSLLSMPRTRVAALAQTKSIAGRWLESMKINIERPLAAILTLNTVAHTVGAAGVGAQAQRIWGESTVTITSAVLTVLILVFSEIIPKTIGAVFADRLAVATAYIVQGMIIVTYPLVIVFQAMSRLLSGGRNPHELTREEMIMLAELGRTAGVLEKDEYRIIGNLFQLESLKVGDIMTPRTVIYMLPKTLTVGEVVEAEGPMRFSRIPIFGEGPDDVAGFVLRTKLLEAHQQGKDHVPISEMSKPLHAVPEDASVAAVLRTFIDRKEQIFQVVDEYGGTAGVVSLEDAIETLLGQEIVDETDPAVDMRELAARLYRSRLRSRKI